jgi:hypothetical protein
LRAPSTPRGEFPLSSLDRKHQLLGIAALVFGGGFAVGAIGHGVRVAAFHSERGHGALTISEALLALEQLVLLAAAAFAAQGFLFSAGSRRVALRDAAAIAAAAYGFGLLGHGFVVQHAFSDQASGAYRAATVLNLAFVAGLLAAALAAAVAFSGRERPRRDHWLAWTGVVLIAANLLSLAGGALTLEAIGGEEPLAVVGLGLGLQNAGFAAAIAAAAIAAGAFFDASRRGGSALVSLARRDLLLAAAAAALLLCYMLSGCGAAIAAVASANAGGRTSLTIATWIETLQALVAAAAAVCVAAAFQPALRRLLQRLG